MPVLYEKRGNVAVITLSRPAARNCWGQDFSDGLIEHFGAAEKDDDVHCVVITGDEAGRAFSAGADLKDPRTHTLETMEDFFTELPRWRKFAARGPRSLSEAHCRGGQRLCDRRRLYSDLLLRSDRRLG